MAIYDLEIKKTIDLNDFEFWGGAEARWNDASKEQKSEIYERILDWIETESILNGYSWIPSEMEINDFVWFDCDDILFSEEE